MDPEQGDGWTAKDYLLTHAHTIYSKMLCTECGRPLSLCSSGTWEVDTRVCRPSAAVAGWRKISSNPEPGVVLNVTQTTASIEGSDTWDSAPQWFKDKYGSKTA